jgi:hypothetical protein
LNTLAPAAVAASHALPSGTDLASTILFTCTSCAYRARMSASYAGKSILCPKCNSTQIAPAVGAVASSPSTGQTAFISKVATATPARGTPALANMPSDGGLAVPERSKGSSPAIEISDKILFTCASCGMRARIPAKYAGATIKCPKCALPGSVPLSDAVEASTGTTVRIERVDLAKASDAKRTSGEIAAPMKRPSGEIAAPATTAAGLDSSPFAGQALLGDKPPAAADDELLDFGPSPAAPPAAAKAEGRKGGVVKRGGSANNLPVQEKVSAPSAKREAPARPPTPAPALDADPDDGNQDEAPRAKVEPPPKKTVPAVSAAKRDGKPTVKPAKKETEEADDAPAAKRAVPAEREGRQSGSGLGMLPLILGGALLLVLVIAGTLLVKLVSTNRQLDASAQEIGTLTKSKDDLNKRLDKAESESRALEAKLDKQRQEAESLKQESDTRKAEFEKQKGELEQKIGELEQKIADQVKAIEAAKPKK